MSALPPKPDIVQYGCNVGFVPEADFRTAAIDATAVAGNCQFSGAVGVR